MSSAQEGAFGGLIIALLMIPTMTASTCMPRAYLSGFQTPQSLHFVVEEGSEQKQRETFPALHTLCYQVLKQHCSYPESQRALTEQTLLLWAPTPLLNKAAHPVCVTL